MNRLARPPARWSHASTDLDDFALITWAVDPERVGRLLPAGFVPDVRDGRALISMVAFRDVGFQFRGAPFARISCGQVNYRTYVRRRGGGNGVGGTGSGATAAETGPGAAETGVWFFGTTLDSVFVELPRRLWQMPWHRGRMRIDAQWGPQRCESWTATIGGGWGAAAVTARGTGRRLPLPAGFEDADEASAILFDPFVGWYARRDGSGVGRYSVWHRPLVLDEAVVDRARCRVFTDLGLIEDGALPLFAGIQRRVAFDVHTPPTREPGIGSETTPAD